jgi:hypothetical protein
MRILITHVNNNIFSAFEIEAALKMRLYLASLGPCSAAFLSCHSVMGSKKIVSSKKFLVVVAMIQALGPQLTWKVLLLQHQYYQIEVPINPELRLNLNSMTDHECKRYFRFSRHQIQMLVSKLGFPDVIIIPNHRDCVMAIEAFCLLLRRLSYPNRWFDLKDNFGRHPSSMSRIFHYVMHFLLQRIKASLISYPLTREKLQQYADAFQRRGVPDALRLFAVIDTKKQKICKPGRNQRALYSGHKRIHCVKYQTLEGPNGLILHGSSSFALQHELSPSWVDSPLSFYFLLLRTAAHEAPLRDS